jgi:hypothetical protein
LCCLTYKIESALGVIDTRELHDNALVLPRDVWLGDTDGIDAVSDDLDRLIERVLFGRFGWFQHHSHAAAKVEAENGSPTGEESAEHCGSSEQNSDDE